MKQQEQGFVLVMTLIISAVISLLVLSSMQHILLYYKAINKQKVLDQSFYQLEAVALQLAADSGNQECVMSFEDANQAMEQLIYRQGCSFKRGVFQYQYVLEELGEFPCWVVYKKNQKHASLHRRVTVVTMEEGSPVSLVQLRWISMGSVAQCMTKEHLIPLGVSSWRYFASIGEFRFNYGGHVASVPMHFAS